MSYIKSYRLSDIAESDISEIYDYTVSHHSHNQAILYLQGLEKQFIMLVDQPNIGKNRDEIRKTLKSFVYEKHTMFYRVLDDHIRIVRVLHSSRDMPKLLQD